jgi:hypothetical protein
MLSRSNRWNEYAWVSSFDIEIDPHGARIIAVRTSLCPGCLSDGEVDAHVRRLKEELDAVAKRAKRLIRDQAKKPLDLEISDT